MYICPKCGREYAEDRQTCTDCGEKLVVKEEEKMIQKEENLKEKQAPILKYAIGITLVAIVVFLIPVVPYNATQAYCEERPYLFSDSSYAKTGWDLSRGCYYVATVYVRNEEDIGGIFTINFRMSTDKGGTYNPSRSGYISPYSTKEFEVIYNTECGENVETSYYVVVPPNRKVKKERTVTRYTSIFNRWTGNVHWYEDIYC